MSSCICNKVTVFILVDWLCSTHLTTQFGAIFFSVWPTKQLLALCLAAVSFCSLPSAIKNTISHWHDVCHIYCVLPLPYLLLLLYMDPSSVSAVGFPSDSVRRRAQPQSVCRKLVEPLPTQLIILVNTILILCYTSLHSLTSLYWYSSKSHQHSSLGAL